MGNYTVQCMSPSVYVYPWKPLWLLIRELRLIQYPLRYATTIIKRLDILKLPVHQLGIHSFKAMWVQFIECLETECQQAEYKLHCG